MHIKAFGKGGERERLSRLYAGTDHQYDRRCWRQVRVLWLVALVCTYHVGCTCVGYHNMYGRLEGEGEGDGDGWGFSNMSKYSKYKSFWRAHRMYPEWGHGVSLAKLMRVVSLFTCLYMLRRAAHWLAGHAWHFVHDLRKQSDKIAHPSDLRTTDVNPLTGTCGRVGRGKAADSRG